VHLICGSVASVGVRGVNYWRQDATKLSSVFTSHAGAAAKYTYCDEHVCVRLSVCLSASISPEPHARSLPLFLVHGQVTIIFVVSVCLFVCLSVCLCSFSQPSLIRFGSN